MTSEGPSEGARDPRAKLQSTSDSCVRLWPIIERSTIAADGRRGNWSALRQHCVCRPTITSEPVGPGPPAATSVHDSVCHQEHLAQQRLQISGVLETGVPVCDKGAPTGGRGPGSGVATDSRNAPLSCHMLTIAGCPALESPEARSEGVQAASSASAIRPQVFASQWPPWPV